MKTLALVVALLATSAFADVDASVALVDAGSPVVVIAPINVPMEALSLDAGVGGPVDMAGSTDLIKTVFVGVKTGNWWLAASAFLVLVVSLLRTAGKKFHDWLPDNNILDKPLWFFFDTRVGGWVLNWLTAIAGGLGTALAAGMVVDFSLWKSVLMVSTSATALFQLWSDVMDWWKKRKAAPAPVPAPAPAPVEPPKP
jgi:uncharacterized membrane protein YbaN (DUF454 family)